MVQNADDEDQMDRAAKNEKKGSKKSELLSGKTFFSPSLAYRPCPSFGPFFRSYFGQKMHSNPIFSGTLSLDCV